jgi:hypothetical protein
MPIETVADSEETAMMASKFDSKRSELKKLASTKSKQKQEWPCTYCEAIFDFRGYLSNHLKKHARDPPGGLCFCFLDAQLGYYFFDDRKH